jgi:acyl-CoA synthetase (AMP-forming)/AMP-acid ligase II
MLIQDIVAINACQRPHETALVFSDGREFTFLAQRDRIARAAGALASCARAGSNIAILSDNCPEYLELYYAAPVAGLKLVFINYRLSAPEIAFILRDSEASLLIYRDGLEALALESLALSGGAIRTIKINSRGVHGSDYEALLAASDPVWRDDADEDEVIWIIYTSGTTGAPKGAMLTHRNLLSTLYNTALKLGANRCEKRRSLAVFPLCHIAAGSTVVECQMLGVPVYLAQAFEPVSWLDAIERYAITDATVAPTMINMLINHPGIEQRKLSSLRTMYYGSSPINLETLQRAIKLFGNVFAQGYGMTEVAGSATILLQGEHTRAIQGETRLLAAAGRPGPLTRVRIADDDGRDLPSGVAGEILIKGDLVFAGYWKNPVATSANLRDGWLHTGDIGCLDEEGFLYVLDRKKDMIITGGENVYTKEVEDVLSKHEAVLEAAVFGVPDAKWGEAVCAAIVPRSGVSPDLSIIEQYCRKSLGGFKVPRRMFLIETLPRNVSGKVLKRTLREMFASAEANS